MEDLVKSLNENLDSLLKDNKEEDKVVYYEYSPEEKEMMEEAYQDYLRQQEEEGDYEEENDDDADPGYEYWEALKNQTNGAEEEKAHVVDKIIKELERCSEMHDYETAHCQADFFLCKLLDYLGYEEVVEAWHKVGKWYA